MKYREDTRDLFTVLGDYYFVQCISADFAMGKGIVVEFDRRFQLKRKLTEKYTNWLPQWDAQQDSKGTCILEGKTLNLITKRNYYEKPSYDSFTHALLKMKEICEANQITQLAMPQIGCGLDRLEWDRASKIIRETFEDTDIEILVCKR